MGKRGLGALPAEVRKHVEVLVDALASTAQGAPVHEVVDDVDRAVEEAFYAARALGEQKQLGVHVKHRTVEFADVIADRLRRRRLEAGWTQADLADAMTRLGFSWKRITVAEVEAGARAPEDTGPSREGRRVSLEELLGLAILYGEPLLKLLLPGPAEFLVLPKRTLHNQEALAAISGNAPSRTLRPDLVVTLMLGENGAIGDGGDNWGAARRAALLEDGEDDWRPAKDLWERRRLGYGVGWRRQDEEG